ncbi:hypothetical protein JTE90_022936 [Oedothorax gibbosus]|uniref:Uncharacterized protein n=1 Tax=Oedothorax gibbosus TaxID=931172 RepID=A0AAV6U7G1_9ARAC|nr:hypothetical protein JTE90_022936 [Oedothorax gibbosus]
MNMAGGYEASATITWKIENFTLCPLKRNVSLESPSFHLGSLDKTEWQLILYPKGKADESIVCDLKRNDDQGPGTVRIRCKFSFVISPGVSELEFKSSSQGYTRQQSTSHTLGTFSELVKKKHVLLPGDVLTIRCRISEEKTDDPLVVPKATPALKALLDCLFDVKTDCSDIPAELYAMSGQQVLDIKRKMFPYIDEYSARTKFGVEKRKFTWPIRNIGLLGLGQKTSVPLACTSKKVPVFVLSLFFKGTEETAQIDIQKLTMKDSIPIYVVCRLAVLDAEGREHVSSEKEKHFDSLNQAEMWSFPTFFNRKDLKDSKCLPNDILQLSCSFNISFGAEPPVMEEYHFTTIKSETYTDPSDMGTMTRDLQSFYSEQKLFDVELNVNGKTLQAHKAVLCSRSPVFSAMFEYDTTEKNTDAIKIPDVDVKTMKRMLAFMYTDSLEHIDCGGTMLLYSAADKYQVLVLKRHCSSFLQSNIDTDNVFNILVLADMHQDEELKMAAEKFLFEPPYEALFSKQFERVIDCSSTLAHSTLQRWIAKLKSDMALNV